MELTQEKIAIFVVVLAIGSIVALLIEPILTPHEASAKSVYNKKCKSDQIDESLCVLGIPDPDFEDKG